MGLFRRKAGSGEPTAPVQQWGQPSRCPECGHAGYLDRIDLIDRIMEQHCPSCFFKWTQSEQELKQLHAR